MKTILPTRIEYFDKMKENTLKNVSVYTVNSGKMQFKDGNDIRDQTILSCTSFAMNQSYNMIIDYLISTINDMKTIADTDENRNRYIEVLQARINEIETRKKNINKLK